MAKQAGQPLEFQLTLGEVVEALDGAGATEEESALIVTSLVARGCLRLLNPGALSTFLAEEDDPFDRRAA